MNTKFMKALIGTDSVFRASNNFFHEMNLPGFAGTPTI